MKRTSMGRVGRWRRRVAVIAVPAAGLVCAALPAQATLHLLQPDSSQPATFVGHGGYSADGLGQNGSGGTIQADVPSGSTVVHAYLYASYFFDNPPSSSDLSLDLDGNPVTLTYLSNSEPGPCCQLSTARADVTSIVAAKVGSGGGITDFTVNTDPGSLDGVGLVVIYSNSTLPVTTIAVLDGGSKQAGDEETLNFASPIHPAAAGFQAVMSVGSGFSYQGVSGHTCGGSQFSTISVNSKLLTNCAGNFDDGVGNNGGLITVGGVGDSLDDPCMPTDVSCSPATDDELYNLKPFLSDGDTSMVIDTTNPSGDDNLFLSVIEITAAASATTEICSNGVDDDGDGKIDYVDPDCIGTKLSSSTYSVNEAAGSLTIPVVLDHVAPADVTVHYSTANGSASAPADYTSTSGTATIHAGDTSTSFSVPIIDDSLVEPDETFTVSLDTPTNSHLASPSTATVTIHDNDSSSGPTCNGLAATLVSSLPTVNGTSTDDVIVLTSSASQTVNGGAGNDTICVQPPAGAHPNDYLYGNNGNDYLQGGAGNDYMAGGGGTDVLLVKGGQNIADGGADNDTLTGGPLRDKLNGNTGTDTCISGGGSEQFYSCETTA